MTANELYLFLTAEKEVSNMFLPFNFLHLIPCIGSPHKTWNSIVGSTGRKGLFVFLDEYLSGPSD